MLTPLESPSGQDIRFRERAVGEGVGNDRFTFEVIALQAYVMGAIVNRERLEGRLKLSETEALCIELLRAIHVRLNETTAYDILRLGIDADEAIDLIGQRAPRYAEPAWGRGHPDDVQRMFAEFCGAPESDILQQIAWSLVKIRGNGHGDWLRTVRIV